MGHRTSASLDIEDLYHIGELAIIYEETDLAVEWMSEVILQEQKPEESKKGLGEKVWIHRLYIYIYIYLDETPQIGTYSKSFFQYIILGLALSQLD